MKSKFIIISLALSIFSSCKKTDVSGVVYSKHNVAISGVEVKVYYSIGSAREPEGSVSITDDGGHYNLTFKSKSGRAYTVRCESDSGKAWEPIKEKHVNIIDLHLN